MVSQKLYRNTLYRRRVLEKKFTAFQISLTCSNLQKRGYSSIIVVTIKPAAMEPGILTSCVIFQYSAGVHMVRASSYNTLSLIFFHFT